MVKVSPLANNRNFTLRMLARKFVWIIILLCRLMYPGYIWEKYLVIMSSFLWHSDFWSKFVPWTTEFEVLSNSPTFNFQQPSTPETSQNVTTSQAASGRRLASPLATVKVVKVDLVITGRPSNLNKYNLSVHINIYNDSEAYIGHIQERVREEMRYQSLLLVGSNGLMFFDQEATRGKLIKVLLSFNIRASSRIIWLLILKKTIILKLFCSKVISFLTCFQRVRTSFSHLISWWKNFS